MLLQGLIGWTDPTYSYDHHNVIFDVPWKGLKRRKIIDGMSIMDPSLQQEHKTNLRNSNLQPDDKNATALELVKPIFSIVKHYPPDWTNQVKPDL